MRFDLHIHSSFSRDGTTTPHEAVNHCKKLGFDGLSIADHNAIQGSLEARTIAAENGLIVLPAVEISAQEGHVLAYGIRELVPKSLSLVETIERIHGLGGLAAAAHPVRFPSGIGLELAGSCKFDAIEVMNGGSSRRGNSHAKKLAARNGLPVTAGSDAHKMDEIGKAYVEVEGVSTEEQLLEAIRKGRTRAGGRSRSRYEGMVYSWETLVEWMKGSFKRL